MRTTVEALALVLADEFGERTLRGRVDLIGKLLWLGDRHAASGGLELPGLVTRAGAGCRLAGAR
jgi:hypothetical protein